MKNIPHKMAAMAVMAVAGLLAAANAGAATLYDNLGAAQEGSDPLLSHGHRKADARRIRDLVGAAQGIVNGPEKLKL